MHVNSLMNALKRWSFVLFCISCGLPLDVGRGKRYALIENRSRMAPRNRRCASQTVFHVHFNANSLCRKRPLPGTHRLSPTNERQQRCQSDRMYRALRSEYLHFLFQHDQSIRCILLFWLALSRRETKPLIFPTDCMHVSLFTIVSILLIRA